MTNFVKEHYKGGHRVIMGGVPVRVSYLPRHEGGRELMRQSSREMCLPNPPRARAERLKWEAEQSAKYAECEKLGSREIVDVVTSLQVKPSETPQVIEPQPVTVEAVEPARPVWRAPARPARPRSAMVGAMRVVLYFRVSTQKQGRSGLGLEAQRAAVGSFCSARGCDVVGEYTEIETGKRNLRPKLTAALHHAKVTGSTLLIAKLDRLSRSVAFLSALQEAQVKFLCVDMPDASELTLHIMASMAQAEAHAISTRTRDALGAAKARGTRLGAPDPLIGLSKAWATGNAASVETIKERAAARAADILPVIKAIQEDGFTSLRAIAGELNARGIITARGGQWGPSMVRDYIMRGAT